MVEGTGLENRQAREGLVGSNPTTSAMNTSFYKSSLKISEYHSKFVFSSVSSEIKEFIKVKTNIDV